MSHSCDKRGQSLKKWLAILAPSVVVIILTAIILSAYWPKSPSAADLPNNPCPIDLQAQRVRQPSEYTATAPPYGGAPPHLLVVVNVKYESSGADHTDEGTATFAAGLPLAWQVPDGQDVYSFAQLVVCSYRDPADPKADSVVRFCDFVGPPGDVRIPLMRATYTYRVYEAKTGRKIAQFHIDGTDSCPSGIEYQDTPPSTWTESANSDDLTRALRPLVEATVPGSGH